MLSALEINRRRQMQGSQVSNLINPKVNSSAKNHILINKKLIKEKQRVLASSGESIFLSSSNVSNRSSTMESKSCKVDQSKSMSQCKTSSKMDLASKDSKETPKKDFIKLNKQISVKQKQVEQPEKMHQTGEIPSYLLNRKAILAQLELERLEALSKSHVPPGMRIMSDQERDFQIEALVKDKDSLLARLHRFPIVVETTRQKRSIATIEQGIQRIEQELEVLNGNFVYIADENSL